MFLLSLFLPYRLHMVISEVWQQGNLVTCSYLTSCCKGNGQIGHTDSHTPHSHIQRRADENSRKTWILVTWTKLIMIITKQSAWRNAPGEIRSLSTMLLCDKTYKNRDNKGSIMFSTFVEQKCCLVCVVDLGTMYFPAFFRGIRHCLCLDNRLTPKCKSKLT